MILVWQVDSSLELWMEIWHKNLFCKKKFFILKSLYWLNVKSTLLDKSKFEYANWMISQWTQDVGNSDADCRTKRISIAHDVASFKLFYASSSARQRQKYDISLHDVFKIYELVNFPEQMRSVSLSQEFCISKQFDERWSLWLESNSKLIFKI